MPRLPQTPHFTDSQLCKGVHAVLEPILFDSEGQREPAAIDKPLVGLVQMLSLKLFEADQARGPKKRARTFFECECILADALDALRVGPPSDFQQLTGSVLLVARIPLAVLTHHQNCDLLACRIARGERPDRSRISPQQWRAALKIVWQEPRPDFEPC